MTISRDFGFQLLYVCGPGDCDGYTIDVAFGSRRARDQPCEAAAAVPAETTPYDLVQNFVRQIATFEEIRVQSVKDLTADRSDFASCVRNNTTFQIDLRQAISYYQSVRLNKSNLAADIPPMIASILQQKLKIIGDLTAECEAFIVPDPKVDYTELAKNAPKITAMSEYSDKNLLTASAGILFAIISQKPDSQNHLSHIVLTRTQRDKLLDDLNTYFGEKLDIKGDNIPYLIAIAQLYRDKLTEYKCADDPWE